MTVRSQFNNFFNEDSLKLIFTKYIIYSRATGIDNLNQYSFRKQCDEQIAIITKKVMNGSYKFSKYKLKLISKGRKKEPREISIPTIRDRIALRAMCSFLQERFKPSINIQLPQDVIKDVKKSITSGQYDGYIKLDISNFYPTIKHDVLTKQLRKRIRSKDILNVIFSALTVPTVSESKKGDKPSDIGVPQGLSISNILAAIYLQGIDKYLSSIPSIQCYRYVDDVLILCNHQDSEIISTQVINKLKKVGLTVHCPIKSPHKSKIAKMDTGFDYLGYQFRGDIISVRDTSIEKIKSSLVGMFTSYKYAKQKKLKFLEWRLNLRITGCIFRNKCKGWLFFFSEINDEKLLHCLDHYVKKLCDRFNVDITPKKFVKSYKEINHRRYLTSYIPNFDNYNLEQMKNSLIECFNFELKELTDEGIKFNFHKKIDAEARDLEVDIKNFS